MLISRSASLFLIVNVGLAVDPLVELTYTSYEGIALPNGVSQWLGIRYAAPPLGNLRFAAPQDPLNNDTVQAADQHGLICLGTPGWTNPTANTTSEDCLFMDVYAPSNATADSKLPIYFFIQGGGFNTDSNPNFNGSGLLEASGMNIVVVNFNYRVGPWGFLSSQEIWEQASVNNGLKDQRKALEWVQNYIAQFGGDPGHVVIGGDSAGAASVTLLLTAYGGRDDGLFHASAAESQSFATVFTVSQTQYQYDNLVIRTECVNAADSLACLRSLSAEFIQSVNFNTPSPGAQQAPLYMYGPVLDYDIITDYTYSAFAKGNYIHVPAIYGDDTNEGTIFVPQMTNNISESDTFIQSQFPYVTLKQLATINSLYPNPNLTFPDSGAFWRQASNAYGEIRYVCPGIFLSTVYALENEHPPSPLPRTVSPRTWSGGWGNTTSTNPIWNYRYNVEDPTQIAEGYGVPHTVEVNAIWGPENVNGAAPASYNTTNAAIVPVIQGYWTSFIRSYNPNMYRFAGSPVWEEFTAGGMERLLFETNATRMEVVPGDQRRRCEYLWSIGLELRQ